MPGMIVSNEPGYYKEKAFGIRIENLVAVKRCEGLEGAERPTLEFETLTLAPIDLNLIDKTLMTQDEIDWLNAYHTRVRETLQDELSEQEMTWLNEATRPV